MLYGIKLTDKQAMLTDEQTGKQVVEVPQPEVPAGYKADWHWEDTGSQLVQTWELKPLEGTAEESMLALAKMQARTLDDDEAAQVPALYDEWIPGLSVYGPDDPDGHPQTRLRRLGKLKKCLQTHVTQAGWEPESAPSLWADVLPGQEGSDQKGPQPWEQPGSTNGYQKGDWVTHNGRLWESTFDGDNVWEPGAVGAPWEDKGPWPQEGGEEAAGEE